MKVHELMGSRAHARAVVLAVLLASERIDRLDAAAEAECHAGNGTGHGITAGLPCLWPELWIVILWHTHMHMSPPHT